MEYKDDSQKENVVLKFFKNLWYDISHSFKYNNMKMAAIFFALPGLLIGFFISSHYSLVNQISLDYQGFQETKVVEVIKEGDNSKIVLNNIFITDNISGEEVNKEINATFVGTPTGVEGNPYVGKYNLTEIAISYSMNDFESFVLDLTSNIRNDGAYTGALSYKIKKDDGNVEPRSINIKYIIDDNNINIDIQDGAIKSLLPLDLSAISVFFLMLVGIVNIFIALNLSSKKNLGSVVTATITTLMMIGLSAVYFLCIFTSYNAISSGVIVGSFEMGTKQIWGIISVCASDLLAIIGVILSWINYDRTYQKVDR